MQPGGPQPFQDSKKSDHFVLDERYPKEGNKSLQKIGHKK